MRTPAVAGQFYPSDPQELEEAVSTLLKGTDDLEAGAALAPHAGYPYSGKLAAKSSAALRDPDTFVLVGPNHTGMGPDVALSGQDWETPLGEVPVDREAVERLDIPVEESAHAREHSLEVQLPLLQLSHGDFSILPIAMKDQSRESAERVWGELSRLETDFAVLASTDLTHYQSLPVASKLDRDFMDAVLDMEVEEMYRAAGRTSVCGYGPTAVSMEYAEERGLRPNFMGHTTSAEATGDTSRVVGYCSIVFT